MNTKDKDIRDALATKEVTTVSKIAFLRHKSEIDSAETAHDYETKTVCAVLTGNTSNDNIDFNISLTHTSIGLIKFQRSEFRIWINLRIFLINIEEENSISCEEDGIPEWIHHFGMNLAKINTEWYKDPVCINIAKNQFIFIGYKNATDCFSQVMIKCKNVDLPETMMDNWALHNYIPNAIQSHSQRDKKRGCFTLWENVQKHDPSVYRTYISYLDTDAVVT
jgi:hypothetical protein